MAATLDSILRRLADHGLLRGDVNDHAEGELPVADVTSDSRKVVPGTLFCAIAGTAADGHRYLPAAAASGAVAALVERRHPEIELPQIEIANGRLAAAHAAAEFFGDPWNHLLVIGVTGTNGKTTTVAILRHLLSRRFASASIGTLGAIGPDRRAYPDTEGLTTPGPIELARLLRRQADAGVMAVAMEVSSHALHQSRVAAVRFDAAVFTNLSRDHLDYHATFDEYRAAKLGLLELLKPGAVVVANADDTAWRGLEAMSGKVVRYGVLTEHGVQVRAQDIRAGAAGVDWVLRTPDGCASIRSPLPGTYNVANGLAAAAALWSLGWSINEIAAGFDTLPQVPGRLERVPGSPNGPAIVIDYAHTPDALERALAALRPQVRGRLIVVFGAGGDRDRGKRPEMGRVAARGADLSIVTSDNPRGEDPERIVDEIESGMGTADRLRILDRREAIGRALDEAGSGDLILLAGKGHETYQILGAETRPFDERVVVRELLAERGVSV